ncbi:C4-dicarboxylate ABC transporter [Methylobacterium mesophilicum SR1.6/6]|uniref:C4-dicarboxylate ABC transporter n=2 Tax=Methylobacterium mesophilicum TaxID=39956 RepID=A0A6B9FX77_9HYPH|nr:C4-dicarboxylate ABC transporter [Methylobacterium mesophilicum SR1.6/6]
MMARMTGSPGSHIRRSFRLGAVVLALSGGPAFAQTTNLRLADTFPASHYIADKITKWFMQTATERSNGAVKFEYYPAEQLGKAKDMLTLVGNGVADIAYVAPSFVTDKLPLSGVAELPLGFTTSCQGTRAFYSLANEAGVIAQRELAPNNVRLLFTVVLPPYQVFVRGRDLKSIADVKSLKIRTSGKAKELAVRALGAVPIQIATPDVYQALSRGTIDGMLFPYSSIYSYDLQDLTKSATQGANFGSFVVMYVISERKWRTLPPAVQETLRSVGREATERGCQISEAQERDDQERLRVKGVSEIALSDADKATVEREMSGIGRLWAKELDDRGKPGTLVLDAFEKASR